MLLASAYLAFKTLRECEHKKWYEQETIPKASIPNPQYTATATANFTSDLKKRLDRATYCFRTQLFETTSTILVGPNLLLIGGI